MMDDKIITIEKIRTGVENEHRFKSVRRGYDKKMVNAYLEDLEIGYRKQLDDEREKTKAVQVKNEQLMNQIDKMNKKIDELRNKIENREATERDVAESLLGRLKETNNRLMEDNSRKKLRIAALEEKIEAMKSDVVSYTEMLVVLDKKLKQMLNDKISECNDVIEAWETQFEKTSEDIKEQMK